MPKVSVIVPVFNVEKYVGQCLESLINQTLKNIEIIIVNDGSTDKSLSICEEYARKDNRIRVYTKENGGLSSARNYGLQFVSSPYVGFVDSDDWVSENFYEVLYNSITVNDCDISATSAIRKHRNSQKYRFNYKQEVVCETLLDKIKTANIPKCCYVWNKLYKTDLVKKNLLTENSYYEDVLWLPNVIKQANRMVFVPNGLYYYRANANSIVKTRQTEKKELDFYNAQKSLIKFFDDNGIKLTEKQRSVTKKRIYLGNILIMKIKELNYTSCYYLFGFIPVCRLTKYPEVEAYHGKS